VQAGGDASPNWWYRDLRARLGERSRPRLTCCTSGAMAPHTAGAIAGSGWSPRPAEKPDSANVSLQIRAEADPHSDDPVLIGSDLMFSAYPAYSLTSEAMFGYVQADVSERPRDLDQASSRPFTKSQRQGSAPQSIRLPRDSSSFFNEAQLASIKTRLKLTPSQQPYWPPLESALRAIQWHRSADKSGHNTQAKSLDLDGEEVQRLRVAASPLVMTLRADQKDEVRTLLQLMGLEQLASHL
jgi:hypothetical protein